MNMSSFSRALRATAFAFAIVAAGIVSAQELKIAVAADVTSADPHFFNLFPNNNMAEQIFDKLVQMDPDSKMIPGLASSWKPIARCTYAMPKCRETAPALQQTAPGRWPACHLNEAAAP